MPALINVLNKTGKKTQSKKRKKIHNFFFVMYDQSIKNAYYLLNEL